VRRSVLVALAIIFAIGAPAAGARTPAPSLFGLNTGTFDPNYAHYVRDLPTARALGARWVHFTGSLVKARRGRPDFSLLDSQVATARRLGLGVLISLGGAPQACSIRPRPSDLSSCPPRGARDLRAYAGYVRTIVARYRGRVRYYESWVEPNHRSFWPTGPDPAEYAALARVQYGALHAADPRARLILAGTGGTDLPFLDRVLTALGGRRAFDLAGAHPYRFPPLPPGTPHSTTLARGGEAALDWRGELRATEALFAAHGYGQPRMWLTEFGWPGSRRAAGAYHLTYAQQAADLRAAYALLRSDPALRFIQAAFWFNLRDYAPGYQNPDPEFFGHYGLLENGFARKPAASAFHRLATGA
jgi:polysaccharide biosynthesis protein PslG